MNVKQTISTLAATLIIAGAGSAMADDKKNKRQDRQNDRAAAAQSRSTAVGVGVAEADRRGATAGAIVGADFQGGRRGVTGNTSTTFGTGAINTTRDSASVAGSTGAAASGTGVQSTSSEIDAYAETNRQGSSADVYGNSTASSGEQPRPRRPR